jgi:hypothetical protein
MPSWSGITSDTVSWFMAGFGIGELAAVTVLAATVSYWLLKRLFNAVF